MDGFLLSAHTRAAPLSRSLFLSTRLYVPEGGSGGDKGSKAPNVLQAVTEEEYESAADGTMDALVDALDLLEDHVDKFDLTYSVSHGSCRTR